MLDEVRTIVAVSGGSMISAFLAARCHLWRKQYLTPEQWESTIAAPFRLFTSHDLNTRPIFIGWNPKNWRNNAGIEALAKACEERGLTTQTTANLPAEPRFLFKASDLVTGREWIFGPAQDGRERKIALAVAVSSSLPGFFRPFTESEPEHIALVDGGLNDNRGVEPVWGTHGHLLIL